MRRRAFTAGLSALAGAMALPVRGQQPGRVYRIGALLGGGAQTMQRYRMALSEQLASHGLVEGRNLEIDARGATSFFHEDRDIAREFVAAKSDAIFVCQTRAAEAALAATKTIPIIFCWVTDPVLSGIVQSLSAPGGNVTGVTNRFGELLFKRIELVRELLPGAKRILVTHYASDTVYRDSLSPRVAKAAGRLGLEVLEYGLPQWAAAIERAAREGAEAVLPIDIFIGNRITGLSVVETANRLRMPAVFAHRGMVEAGGLISIGTDLENDIRRGADLLARVLAGADPAAIPVDQATRFETVLNAKTARAIGLAVPQPVYLRVDRLID